MNLGSATSKLKVIITAQDKASATFDKIGGKMKITAGQLKMVGLAAVGAMTAIGVQAVKAATAFESEMANVATLVDTSRESMLNMGKQVQEMSKRVPKDIGELTKGLYNVRSAGISSAKAMDVLETSGKLATAGLSTTEEAVDLLTSAINVYGDDTHDATKIADILFTTVKAGKTTVAGLAQGFGKVAGIAKETGVGLEDLSAATAMLTTTGITASEAQTSLKAVLSNILKPTSDAKNAAEELGISFDLAALEADGLSGMLVKIQEKAGDDKQALADLFGSVEAANAIFSLTSSEGGAAFKGILDDMNESSGNLNEAFLKQNETTAAQYQLLKNNLNVVMTSLGTVILPALITAVEWATPLVDTLSWVFNVMAGNISDTTTEMGKLEAKLFVVSETIKGVWRDLTGLRGGLGEAIANIGWRLRAGMENIIPSFTGLDPILESKQTGGYISETKPYLLHQGETVVPANKNLAPITVNINGGNYLSEDAAEMLGNKLIDQLKYNLKL